MNGFTIKNYQDTASFELEVIQRGNVDDIDASVRTKYDFQGRTINSTHRWSFGRSILVYGQDYFNARKSERLFKIHII